MNVTSSGIVNGVIQPQYGGHGTQFNENGIPTYSLPFTVEDAPQGTVSVAIVLEDKDAYPVTGGFAWIHWLAANITRFEIKENESQTADDFVQGRNSWTSIQGGGNIVRPWGISLSLVPLWVKAFFSQWAKIWRMKASKEFQQMLLSMDVQIGRASCRERV